jgi:hypothetical protein
MNTRMALLNILFMIFLSARFNFRMGTNLCLNEKPGFW